MSRTPKAVFSEVRATELGVRRSGTSTGVERRAASIEQLLAMPQDQLRRVCLSFYDLLHSTFDTPIAVSGSTSPNRSLNSSGIGRTASMEPFRTTSTSTQTEVVELEGSLTLSRPPCLQLEDDGSPFNQSSRDELAETVLPVPPAGTVASPLPSPQRSPRTPTDVLGRSPASLEPQNSTGAMSFGSDPMAGKSPASMRSADGPEDIPRPARSRRAGDAHRQSTVTFGELPTWEGPTLGGGGDPSETMTSISPTGRSRKARHSDPVLNWSVNSASNLGGSTNYVDPLRMAGNSSIHEAPPPPPAQSPGGLDSPANDTFSFPPRRSGTLGPQQLMSPSMSDQSPPRTPADEDPAPELPMFGDAAMVSTSPVPTPRHAASGYAAPLHQFVFGDGDIDVAAASLANDSFFTATAKTPMASMARSARAARRMSSVVSMAGFFAARRTSNVEEESVQSEGEDYIKKVNQFMLLEVLGQGAQGTVYLAFDEKEDEFRAVKELKRPLASSSAMEQIRNEINIMKDLRHKNIVTLHEILDDPRQKRLYLVLQYVEKGVLVKYNGQSHFMCEKIPPTKLAFYARQMCAGLSYLHRHGILHRDIKPENILLGKDDHVYLADFGVAQTLKENDDSILGFPESIATSVNIESVACSSTTSSRQSHMGSSFALEPPPPLKVEYSMDSQMAAPLEFASTRGTPAFIAPEVVKGKSEKETDVAAVDVWALGVTLYMFLTGVHPFYDAAKAQAAATMAAESGPLTQHSGSSESPTLTPTMGSRCSGSPNGSHRSTPRAGRVDITPAAMEHAILHHQVEVPSEFPRGWRKVLHEMLEKDPKKRIPLEEARGAIKAMN